MASASVAFRIQAIDASSFRNDWKEKDNTANVEDGKLTVTKTEHQLSKYPQYLPYWDTNEKYPPLEEFEFKDVGLKADPTLPNLFPRNAAAYKNDLTPKFGTEVRGIQLSSLSSKGKDELALYVAQRGVVVFRDQDFKDLPIQEAAAYGEYFGHGHVHPTSGSPNGFPEIHLVYRQKDDKVFENYFATHISSVAYHSDVSFEKQPPGTTFLAMLEGPPTGGDTIFVDTQEAYERLSPLFQEKLAGLTAVHSAYEQAEASRQRGGVVRREPVSNIHPVIRQHPVTKKKSIYVNPQFTRNIVGLKVEESDAILNFLYDVLNKSHDFQVRAKWEPGSVVVWDNRRASHSALLDWGTGQRRHAFRLTPQAEKPTENWD